MAHINIGATLDFSLGLIRLSDRFCIGCVRRLNLTCVCPATDISDMNVRTVCLGMHVGRPD